MSTADDVAFIQAIISLPEFKEQMEAHCGWPVSIKIDHKSRQIHFEGSWESFGISFKAFLKYYAKAEREVQLDK